MKDIKRLEERVKKLEKTIKDFMDEFGPSVQRKRAQRDEKWDEMIRVLTIQEEIGMSDLLTKEQRLELERLLVEITEEAISVRMDYEENGSELDSGSLVAIHQNSPLLDDEKEKLSDIAYNVVKKEKK